MYRRFTRHLLFAGIGIALALTPAYSATIAQYSDSVVFDQFTQGTKTITFDDQSEPSYKWNSGGFTVDLVQFVGFYADGSNYTALLLAPGSSTNVVLEGPGMSAQHLHIVLPIGVTAVGMNLATVTPDSGSYTISLSTGGDTLGPIATLPISSGLVPTFWGVTSDTAIDYMDISSSQGIVVVDNFKYGAQNADADPPAAEAATLILIGTGLLGLPLLRKIRPIGQA
jgi:hypothetical protein